MFSFALANMCNPMEATSNISFHKGWDHADPELIKVWTELVGSAKNIQIFFFSLETNYFEHFMAKDFCCCC